MNEIVTYYWIVLIELCLHLQMIINHRLYHCVFIEHNWYHWITTSTGQDCFHLELREDTIQCLFSLDCVFTWSSVHPATFEILAFKVTPYRLGIPLGYDITSIIIYICEYIKKIWKQPASHRQFVKTVNSHILYW